MKSKSHQILNIGPGLLTAILFIVLEAVLNSAFVGATRDELAVIHKEHATVSQVKLLGVLLHKTQSDERGYLLTGRLFFLPEIAANKRSVRDQMNHLSTLCSGYAAQEARLCGLILSCDDWLDQLDNATRARKAGATNTADLDVRLQNQMDAILSQLNEVDASQAIILNARVQQSEARTISLQILASLLRFVALALIVSLWLRNNELARQRKTEKQANIETEARFEMLFQHSSEPHLLYEDDAIVACNRAAAALLGYENDRDVIGKGIRSFISPMPSTEECLAAHDAGTCAQSAGVHRFECICTTAAGHQMPIRMSLSRILMGGKPVVIAVLLDLSEIKRAERAKQELIRERDRTLNALRESETQLLEAQNLAHCGSWSVELATGEIVWSDELRRIAGLDANGQPESLASHFSRFEYDDAARIKSAYERCVQLGEGFDFDVRMLRSDGMIRHVHAVGRVQRNEAGEPARFLGTIVDVTERKSVEEALRKSQQRYRMLFDNNPQPMWVIDSETTRFEEVNPAALQHYGYTRAEFLAMTAADLLVATELPELNAQNYLDHMKRDQRYWGVVRHKRRNGSEIDVEILSNPTTFVSGRSGRLMLVQDVTARLNAERQIQAYTVALEIQKRELQSAIRELEALATTDGLTGAKNHRAFQERFNMEFKIATRCGTALSLIMIDVDLFKPFNDLFGHPAGDRVLRSVAAILVTQAPEAELVARYGGEEFAVILPKRDTDQALAIAERMRLAIENAEWQERPVTASFGIASVSYCRTSANDLLALADQALYQAKLDGRNRVNVARQVRIAAA